MPEAILNRPWSVVIPSDRIDAAANCAASILKMHIGLSPSKIVVVSKSITPAEIGKAVPGATLIRDPSEFCFARRVNIGVENTGQNDVVLVGDDVEVVTAAAFDQMSSEAPLRILSASIQGRVGPWWQQTGRISEVPFVSFVCVYLPRQVLQMVGPFDESFPGYGYEDTDYCIRARRAGLSCGVSDVIVEHGVTVRSNFIEKHAADLSEMERAARAAFAAKWFRRLV
jgi:GT2 family glycosyltransferase